MTARAEAAASFASAGWPVFPAHGKVPLTDHGHKDGTTDLEQVGRWWRRWPNANVAARVPDSLVVVDVDPRANGHLTLTRLETEHGCLPPTLTVKTGGHELGRHLYFLRPPGALSNGSGKLGLGLDVKLAGRGYTVLPPSIHPETGRRYEWLDLTAPARMPAWLVTLLRPPVKAPPPSRPRLHLDGDRPGDRLAAEVTWSQILEPYGWTLVQSNGAGERWCRPGKSGGISATTDDVHLYVFTSSAPPFEPDTAYTKFAAWTMLNCGGDFREAARRLRRGAA
ncbi:MAG: bifunctional DNA primase/polymerase [Acidimicrobiales bacterium]